MNIRKHFVIATALGAIVFAFSTAAFGQTESPNSVRTQVSLYGMHFVSGGQSVRVAVQNACLSNPAAIIPCVSPDPEIQPCIRVRIVFDVYETAGDGSVRLRFVRRVSREVELDPGEAATFDFAGHRNGDWVSPAVFARCEENCPSDPNRIRALSTVSIRQGASSVLLLPAVLKGFDPQPDPPAAREQ